MMIVQPEAREYDDRAPSIYAGEFTVSYAIPGGVFTFLFPLALEAVSEETLTVQREKKMRQDGISNGTGERIEGTDVK